MKPITIEWVEKAEADFMTIHLQLEAPENPNYDDACFHAQQCAEKYLKACLQEYDIPCGKTHNLVVLLDLLITVRPECEKLRPLLRVMRAFAVVVRYPGLSADREMAEQALELCKQVREKIRGSLGLIT